MGTTGKRAFLMVSGPSGVGKTSFVSGLIDRWPSLYTRPISYTSRTRRKGESDAEYRFVEKEWILEESKRGRLANLDFVYGNYYAMDKASIEAAFASGRSPIKEIHPSNYGKIRAVFEKCIGVLFLPDGSSSPQLIDISDTRAVDDSAYYSRISLNDFEIVARSSKDSGLDTLIADTHTAIQAFLENSDGFPHPSEIDRLNAEGYGKLAGHFTALERPTTANFHDLSSTFFGQEINKLPTESRCLEIGPGQGWLRRTFDWPNIQYTAVDISSGMISTLDFEKNEHSRLVASARALPFSSSSFDFVFSSLGDGYCYPLALVEIRRILKMGGAFFFSAPSGVWAQGIRHDSKSNRTVFKLSENEQAEVFSFAYPIKQLSKLLSDSGFRVLLSNEVRGNQLSPTCEVSPALTASAKSLGVTLKDLPIVNVAKAVRVV